MCSRNNAGSRPPVGAFPGLRLNGISCRILLVCANLLFGAAVAQAENSLTSDSLLEAPDPIAAKWTALRTRIEGWDLTKIKRPSKVKIIRRSEPFVHVIAEGARPRRGWRAGARRHLR